MMDNEIASTNKYKNILICLFVLILIVTSLLIFIGIKRCEKLEPKNSEENTSTDKIDKTFNISAIDIENAINKGYLYNLSPYSLITNDNSIVKDLDTARMLYISTLFNYDTIKTLNTLFDKNYTKDEAIDASDNQFYLDDEGNVLMDGSIDEWSNIKHARYNTTELDGVLEIYEYVLYEYGGTPGDEEHYYLYPLDYDRNEHGVATNSSELIATLTRGGDPDEYTNFNMDDYKDKASKVKWTFEKNSSGSYSFKSLELIKE